MSSQDAWQRAHDHLASARSYSLDLAPAPPAVLLSADEMPTRSPADVGDVGERFVLRYLQERGYRVDLVDVSIYFGQDDARPRMKVIDDGGAPLLRFPGHEPYILPDLLVRDGHALRWVEVKTSERYVEFHRSTQSTAIDWRQWQHYSHVGELTRLPVDIAIIAPVCEGGPMVLRIAEQRSIGIRQCECRGCGSGQRCLVSRSGMPVVHVELDAMPIVYRYRFTRLPDAIK